jgi:hypothetical protein
MATSHLTLAGDWETCGVPACDLLFHLDMGVAEAKQLPKRAIYPLLEVAQPPTEVRENGQKLWRDSRGSVHRDYDLPAVLYLEGDMLWYQHGNVHRDHDRPAYIGGDGSKSWHQYGKLHRDHDLPALVSDEELQWYWHDEQHREGDKPASINSAAISWYRAGVVHRENDQPAVIYDTGGFDWAENGKLTHTKVPNPRVLLHERKAYMAEHLRRLGEPLRDENGYPIS